MGGSVVLKEMARRVQALQGLGLRLEGFRVSGSGSNRKPLTASHKTHHARTVSGIESA